MRRHKLFAGKNRAQAMVEFALALPILLLLLYGILEAGRLLFIYSSIVTASRQAARYGSATGSGPNGLPRYQECAAIKAAAQKADYLNAFDDSDIVITYDKGDPGTGDDFDTCDGTTDTGVTEGELSDNESRIVVTITGDFLPIVPKLVPFIERSSARGNPITAVSSRTILVSISIYVTAPPSTWVPSTPTSTLTATNTASPTATATSTVPPTSTATATRTVTPGGPTFTATATRTATGTATATIPATITPTGTIQPTATTTGTAVSQCLQLTSTGVFTKAGNTMTVKITNPNNYPVSINNIFVQWNGDRGHSATGQGDDTLDLQSVSLGTTVIWTGLVDNASSATVTPAGASVPASAVNLTVNFNFHQSYDRWDTPAAEQVTITFNNPTGCTLNVLNIVR